MKAISTMTQMKGKDLPVETSSDAASSARGQRDTQDEPPFYPTEIINEENEIGKTHTPAIL